MVYRIDWFFDDFLRPLAEARSVRITFSKDVRDGFGFRSAPINPHVNPEVSRAYDFSLVQTGGYVALLSSAYYLLSMPRESIPSLRPEELPELMASPPFMVTYDPSTERYTILNHYMPSSGTSSYPSFSQVLGHISQRWYFLHVEHPELPELFPTNALVRRSQEELYALVSHPNYGIFIEYVRSFVKSFGSHAVADFSTQEGVLHLLASRRTLDPSEANEHYRTFGHSLGEDLSRVFFRNVFLVLV